MAEANATDSVLGGVHPIVERRGGYGGLSLNFMPPPPCNTCCNICDENTTCYANFQNVCMIKDESIIGSEWKVFNPPVQKVEKVEEV